MRAIIFILVFLLPGLFAEASQTHLQKLLTRYPDSIIGEDYGVLDMEDLAVNSCVAKATPFRKGENTAYSYWQCFSTKDARMICSSLIDSLTKETFSYLSLEAKKNTAVESYLARGPLDIKECRSFLRLWKQKTEGERYVCASGIYVSSSILPNGWEQTNWVFDKFKTRKGCESYKSDCHLEKDPKNTQTVVCR